MSDRTKNNEKVIQSIGKGINEQDPATQKTTVQLNAIAAVLMDISRSLAIIADKLPMNPDEKLLLSLMNEEGGKE